MDLGKTEKSIQSGANSQHLAMLISILLLASGQTHAAGYGTASWEESNKRINLKSVCANHSPGSINARKCRAEAANYFKRQCVIFKKKANGPSATNRARYKADKDKYCYATRHFKIIAR